MQHGSTMGTTDGTGVVVPRGRRLEEEEEGENDADAPIEGDDCSKASSPEGDDDAAAAAVGLEDDDPKAPPEDEDPTEQPMLQSYHSFTDQPQTALPPNTRHPSTEPLNALPMGEGEPSATTTGLCEGEKAGRDNGDHDEDENNSPTTETLDEDNPKALLEDGELAEQPMLRSYHSFANETPRVLPPNSRHSSTASSSTHPDGGERKATMTILHDSQEKEAGSDKEDQGKEDNNIPINNEKRSSYELTDYDSLSQVKSSGNSFEDDAAEEGKATAGQGQVTNPADDLDGSYQGKAMADQGQVMKADDNEVPPQDPRQCRQSNETLDTANTTISSPETVDDEESNRNSVAVGAFRIFPDERRVERAERAEDVGGTRPARLDLEAQVAPLHGANGEGLPMLEASLVDDRLFEAHPIHLTHVPISSIPEHQQRQQGEDDDDDGEESGGGKAFGQKRSVSSLLLVFAGVAVAAGVGAYFGTKDKAEDGVAIGSGSFVNANGTSAGDPSVGAVANDVPPITWEKVGSDIPGAHAKNRAGSAVATSSDGKIIAIGSPYNSDVALQVGHVRVFAWNHTAKDWTQRGSTLLGDIGLRVEKWEQGGGQFGWSLALSGSGDTLVCGAPLLDNAGQVKVFKWDETLSDYVARGSIHEGRRWAWENWGWDVDVSDDGLTVAVGAPGTTLNAPWGNLTSVSVLRWNTTTDDWDSWEYTTKSIYGEQGSDEFGTSVSLSADGRTFAAGAIHYNDTSVGAHTGKTRVFKWDEALSDWVQLGTGIVGEAAGDFSGWSTDLSADGKTLAISATRNKGVNGRESGHVRVFVWDESKLDWAQLGSDIDGSNEDDRFGIVVSLADDGRTIASTSIQNHYNGLRSGHCRVFQWSDKLQDWVKIGQDIRGESGDNLKGVALSGPGDTLVVGSWGSSQGTGHVRVYKSHQSDGG